MKKSIFVAFLFSTLGLEAQITINTAELPVAGQVWVNANDNSYTDTIPPGGASQTWNFSSLTNTMYDTILFVNAASTPYASSFPASTLAIPNLQDSTYIYCTSNSSGFYLDGYYLYSSTLPFPSNTWTFNPSNLFIPIPFTFNDTRTSYYRYVIDVDTALPFFRLTHLVNQFFSGDGYGSLQLPNATYANTLRIKSQELSYDSTLMDTAGLGNYFLIQPPTVSQLTNYFWYKNGHPSLLLNISADSAGLIGNTASYHHATLTGVNDPVSENTSEQVLVFPNPSGDQVFISIPPNDFVKPRFLLYDGLGRFIRDKPVQGIQLYSFFTSNLGAGTYFYQIVDESRIHYSGKIVVK